MERDGAHVHLCWNGVIVVPSMRFREEEGLGRGEDGAEGEIMSGETERDDEVEERVEDQFRLSTQKKNTKAENHEIKRPHHRNPGIKYRQTPKPPKTKNLDEPTKTRIPTRARKPGAGMRVFPREGK